MTAHNATAERVRPPMRGGWYVSCPAGCPMPRVASKEQAEHEAMVHRIRAALTQLRCDCFDPDEVEFFGNHPCPRCQIADAIGGAA